MNSRRPLLFEALHIFVLTGFAVAQPLFDLLARSPEFFIARRSKPVDIVFLALVLSILVPALLVAIELGLRRIHSGLGRWTHRFFVAGFTSLIVLPVLKQFEGSLGALSLLAGAGLIGMVAATAYAKWTPVRTFLSILSPAILLFPVGFLFSPGISKVMLGNPAPGVALAATSLQTTTPVVLVIFDEFAVTSLMNQDHEVDAVLYPNFAALGKEATWFRNTTTVADNTSYAVPAILTGNYPDHARFPILVDHPNNLFTLLAGSYDFHAIESITELCPVHLCARPTMPFRRRMRSLRSDLSRVYPHLVLPDHFLRNLPPVTHTWNNFKKDKQGARFDLQGNARTAQEGGQEMFETFLSAIRPQEQKPPVDHPGFYFLHSMPPHYPWDRLPSGKQYGSSRKIHYFDKEQWVGDPTLVTQGYQRHLLQVGYVDRLLGRLVARLKAAGIYDRALVVVASDHGSSFTPNEKRRPLTEENHRDIMSVPFFLKTPHQVQGAISDRALETVDIVPTITDVLDIPLPWPVDGRSAFDLTLPERQEQVIFADQARRRQVYRSDPQAKYATLDYKLGLFGSEIGEAGLFRIGPHPALLGRPVDRFLPTTTDDVRVRLDDTDRYRQIDPASDFVPAQITGQLVPARAGDHAPYSLAVAVNGVIRATTQTFQYKAGDSLFSVIVPEASFRPGENQVEVFVISEAVGGEPQITRVELAS